MNITRVEVQWMIGFANDPKLRIYIDCPMPKWSEIPHHKQANGVIYAQQDFLIHFIYMGNGMRDGEGGEWRGFGGAHMKYPLDDGTFIESNDAWSSSPKAVELPCTEVVVSTPEYGGVSWAGAITLEKFEELVKEVGAYIVDGVISSEPDRVAKPH